MSEIIIVKPEKCTGCNTCVRVCPAPEANITKMLDDGRYLTTVNSSKCIACGECVKSCKNNARDYIDDTEAFMAQMAEDKMIILVAPAIKINYPSQWKSILDWFKKKGCLIYDVSFGADICSWAHIKAIEYGKLSNTVTQPCAAVVNYIEMYQPKLLQSISPIQSPAGCAAVYIKKYLRRNNKIAFLSPCIAKKMEFEETGLIDFNVTFKKLLEYFAKNDIKIPTGDVSGAEYDFDDAQGLLGSLYSRPGGLRDNILQHNPNVNIINSEGTQKVYRELDTYANLSVSRRPDIFDVLSCEYGCNSGPATGTSQSGFELMANMRMIETELMSKHKSKNLTRSGDDKQYKRFDDELDLSDFIRQYKPSRPSPIPSPADLEPIFEAMGKKTREERTYNCHACGYSSCTQMATAILRGQNVISNCIVHAKSILSVSNEELSERNKKISEITNECLSLSSKLTHDIKDIAENMSTINDSTAKTKKRADVVSNLLKNVVVFCNENPSMDNATVAQLIQILEATIKAFSSLDENIDITNSSSEMINSSVAQIKDLIEDLNASLGKSQNE